MCRHTNFTSGNSPIKANTQPIFWNTLKNDNLKKHVQMTAKLSIIICVYTHIHMAM